MKSIMIDGRGCSVQHDYDPKLILPPDIITMAFADVIIDNLRPDQRILDLGAAGGVFTVRGIMRLRDPRGLVFRLVDIDPVALEIATTNVERAISVRGFSEEQVRFEIIQANWIDRELAEGNTYHFVYFNPPYLPDGEEVHGEATRSPHTAMYAGETGLEEYAKVFPDIHRIMADHGMLLVREPYRYYAKMVEHSCRFDPPRQSHSAVIDLFVKVSNRQAFPVPYHFSFQKDGRVVKAGGGFIAQYFVPAD